MPGKPGEEIPFDYRLDTLDGGSWPCEGGSPHAPESSWGASSQWSQLARACRGTTRVSKPPRVFGDAHEGSPVTTPPRRQAPRSSTAVTSSVTADAEHLVA